MRLWQQSFNSGSAYSSYVDFWNSGNDGSGSGLDADLLDGQQASAFATSSHSHSYLPLTGGTLTGDITTNEDFISTGRDNGVFGSYNSTQTDHIWSIGTSYRNHTAGTNFGNLYGLAYKHTNNSTGGTMAGGHQMVWCNNGTPRAAIGYDRFWHAASGDIWGSSNDGSGSGLDADTVDGHHLNQLGILAANQTWADQNYFLKNRGATLGVTDSPALQACSTSNHSAFLSFHKHGHYAVNMGLDSDNVLRIGGWSASANRLQLDMAGNLTTAGNVTAYSDIRLKENIKVIPNALAKVQKIRGVTFTRNDTDDAEMLHAGVIAQEVEAVLPEVVSEDASGIKNVAYGNMVALLIEAIKEQQTQIDELKAQLGGA